MKEFLYIPGMPYVVAALCLMFLAILPKIADIMPSVLGCCVRWKESWNLYRSLSLSRSRDLVAITMVMPYIILIGELNIYPPAGEGLSWEVFLTTGIALAAYVFVRLLCQLIFKGEKINREDYLCATRMQYTFFVVLCSVSFITWFAFELTKFDKSLLASILTWEMLIVYSLFLIRKTQFFTARCGFFKAFLYLCTLEFLPTGLLIASALVL